MPDIGPVAGRKRFDLAGAVTGTRGLVLLVDAISQAPQYGWGSTRTIVLVVVSVAVLVAFVFAGSLYMQRVLHYSPLQNGAAWLAGSVTSMAFAGFSQCWSPASGRSA